MNATPAANEAALLLLEMAGEYVPHHPIARALWLERGDLSTTEAMDALSDRAEELAPGEGWATAYEVKRLSEFSKLRLDVSICDDEEAAGVLAIASENSFKPPLIIRRLDRNINIDISVDYDRMKIANARIEDIESESSFYMSQSSIMLSELQRLMPTLFARVRELARA